MTKSIEVSFELDSEKIKTMKNKQKRILINRFISNKRALFGSIIIGIILLLSVFVDFIVPYDPNATDVQSRLQPPGAEHFFGTDNFGRDLLSRVIYGIRISAIVGFSTTILSCIIGLIIGLYASYYKRLDNLLMRMMDGFMAFPATLLAIAIVAALGPSVRNLIICLTIVFVPSVARIVRSSALVAKEQTFVQAMSSLGASDTRIIWKHIMPNTLSALIVQATFVFSEAMIIEAALSFLGAGVPEPTASLGNLLSAGKLFIYNSWWMTLFPGLALALAILGAYFLGDGLRDLMDSKTRKAKK
ncbi:ABC transporter permease [Ureibacillus sp. NPDC094379]